MRSDWPPETPASAQARAEAVVDWLDAATFESLLYRDAGEGRTLNQHLQSGTVFAVWVPERDLYLFPSWQLDPTGRPSPALAEVLALLRGQYGGSAEIRVKMPHRIRFLLWNHVVAG
ncbi:hypothetical protein PDM28_09315 [Stenotrophomonas aracearum]|jgi:hypothetical protein|uniref:Uncharacterized protein n=1 Tax=Stenotrophomonas aracearum TaxID=3003272 RepID=A0ABY9YID8_9GAMM|nr:hypothetical protein [Stenotrophomonas sp. A5588]WNH50467.1 hypothetical protein PDM28_09315 [Stenotrophomonas sp. A5588]